MHWIKQNIFLSLSFLVLLVLATLFVIIPVVSTYIITSELNPIDNPIEYTTTFEETQNTQVHLSRSGFYGGQKLISPLFPNYRSLELKLISQNEVCTEKDAANIPVQKVIRYMASDPLWKVFWIGISGCSRERFFGPYKLPTNY